MWLVRLILVTNVKQEWQISIQKEFIDGTAMQNE